jgi:hypothetical protein
MLQLCSNIVSTGGKIAVTGESFSFVVTLLKICGNIKKMKCYKNKDSGKTSPSRKSILKKT